VRRREISAETSETTLVYLIVACVELVVRHLVSRVG
jgi:hypothetical protein